MTESDRGLPLKEAAQRLGVAERTLRLWVTQGRLPATKLGKLWVIKESNVTRLLDGDLQLEDPKVPKHQILTDEFWANVPLEEIIKDAAELGITKGQAIAFLHRLSKNVTRSVDQN